MAHKSPRITTQIVGVHDFPEKNTEYQVTLVPKIWVNDKIYIDGAAPTPEMMEMALVLMIKQSLDPDIPKGKLRIGG
jgi:hypothetical protein